MKPLSSSQETRLISHLDNALLSLSRAYSTRHLASSSVSSLSLYLQQLEPLLSLVLSIPPVKPSNQIRIAYSLQLTGLVNEAVVGYGRAADQQAALDEQDSQHLWSFLKRLDKAWRAVLEAKEWDSRLGTVKPNESTSRAGPSPTLRQTDIIRLNSIILDLQQSLREVFGLPLLKLKRGVQGEDDDEVEMLPMRKNPFVADEGEVVDDEMSEMSTQGTPSLVGADSSETGESESEMEVDTDTEDGVNHAVAIRDEMEGEDQAEEDDDDEDDFEEVTIPSSVSTSSNPAQQPRNPSSTSATPVNTNGDGSFSISFRPPPPTAPHLNQPPSEFIQERTEDAKGFDPDEEYGDSDEEEERAEVSVETKERIEGVLQETRDWLDKVQS